MRTETLPALTYRPLEAQPDDLLLERYARTRDGAAFAALVRRHGPGMLRLCRWLLRDHPRGAQDAEDCYQEAFLVLMRKAHEAPADALAGWLHAVARHTALRARRGGAYRCSHEKQVGPHDLGRLPAPPADADPHDWTPLLLRELDALPRRRQREALSLCYLRGLTCAEAARRLGCSPSAVLKRLARGRRELARRLCRRRWFNRLLADTCFWRRQGPALSCRPRCRPSRC